jgi:GT2 family glycosyltransferase
MKRPDVSIVIVSFNTREVLRECLEAIRAGAGRCSYEVIVVDNGSTDESAAMVKQDFPECVVVETGQNLGFAGANNVGFGLARGRYTVLLNSDAFLSKDLLETAVQLMDAHPEVGLAGGLLTGRDGSWQPSARQFPSLLNDLLSLSGLASRFPDSRFFGKADRTWADSSEPAETDWVPGAFSIIRSEVLSVVGSFDERFFLYYEEVDLCRRIKSAGFKVQYWPQIKVVHIGGESARSLQPAALSSSGAQLLLWRWRSCLLYYRKHHGGSAWWALHTERMWHALRWLRNAFRGEELKKRESQRVLHTIAQAWNDTAGGRLCPERPW